MYLPCRVHLSGKQVSDKDKLSSSLLQMKITLQKTDVKDPEQLLSDGN